MIISGGSRSNGGFFAKHLTNDRDREKGNDRAELCEMRGVTAHTVDGFFRELGAVAAGTRCKNFFYHANINPRAHEHLTPEQWTEAVDTLEKNLGLEGQARFVMEHEKEGRVHRHVIWSRIDPDTMLAISDKQTAKIHERTSRDLETRFDLVRGESVLEPGRAEPRERGSKAWENFRGLKSGIDPNAIKAELTELWHASDNGRSFAAALHERGYVLARGDRRDFLVFDHAGDDHSLARRLDGVKTAEVRAYMADIDRASLPGADEARAAQRAKFTRDGIFDRDAAALAWASRDLGTGRTHHTAQEQDRASTDTPHPDRDQSEAAKPQRELGRDARAIRDVWQTTKDGRELVDALQGRGYMVAQVSVAEAQANERQHAFAEAVGNTKHTLREGDLVAVNAKGHVTLINEHTTGDTREVVAERLAGVDRRTLTDITDAQTVMREVSAQEFYARKQAERPSTEMERIIAKGLVQSRGVEGGFVHHLEEAGIKIARATADDIADIRVRHEKQKEIRDRLPDAPRMNEGDLFAVKQNGAVYRLNPYRLDFQAIEQRLSDDGQPVLSVASTRSVHGDERLHRRQAAADERHEAWKEWAKDQHGHDAKGPASRVGSAGVRVADGLGKIVGSLADFLADLFTAFFVPQESPRTAFDRLDDDPAERVAEIMAERRAEAALENIAEDLKHGNTVSAQDIRNLTPADLQNLRDTGDAGLLDMVRRMEEDRAREREAGYGRER